MSLKTFLAEKESLKEKSHYTSEHVEKFVYSSVLPVQNTLLKAGVIIKGNKGAIVNTWGGWAGATKGRSL